MYSTRSNASQRKPFDIYQFGLKPQFPLMDTERPDPPKTLGFGTLPSPKFQTPAGGIIPPGMTTPNNYRTDTPEVLKTRWNPDMEPDHQRLISLGYPVGGNRNVVIDSPEFPRQMERSLEAQWANADQYGARAGFNGSWLDRGSNSVNEGRTPIPQNMDLFDELGAGPMIKPLPMSVLTGQGEKPIQPIQLGTDARADVMVPDGQGGWVASAYSPDLKIWKYNPNDPEYMQNLQDEYNHSPGLQRSMSFEQFAQGAQNEVNFAPDVDPAVAMAHRGNGGNQQGGPLYTRQRRAADMQGAPMGATPGSITPNQQDPMMLYQPQNGPMMQSDPMPYKGGMSGPHFQGQMQSMLGDLLNRQNMGRQYNDMAMSRDGYDDAWDRARANFFNPLMGALLGGKQIAAMQSDSNNRMNQIMDRRQLRRQAMNDQWGQTKDLVNLIAANDPQALKNQFQLQKLQYELMQKQINAQNANTQQFNSQTNAAYKSRMATVQEQRARTAEGNLQRMITEGADRSQRGWAMIESNRSKWEASLEMRQAELEQRKQQAAASNDIRMMQLIQKEEADLADEEFKYQKLSSELEAKAAEVDKFGAPKRSSEFVDKYGTKAPGKEPAPQQNQAVDIINALGRFFQPAGSQQPSAPAAAAPKPVPGKTQAAKPAAAGGGKPLTANVVQMLKAKFPNDMKAAMAEARRLGYKVD